MNNYKNIYRGLTRIYDLKKLKYGWYEGGGKPINCEVAKVTLEIYMFLSKRNKNYYLSIFPTPQGNLLIEYDILNNHLNPQEISIEIKYMNGIDIDVHIYNKYNDNYHLYKENISTKEFYSNIEKWIFETY